jgi:hypothetical protein
MAAACASDATDLGREARTRREHFQATEQALIAAAQQAIGDARQP